MCMQKGVYISRKTNDAPSTRTVCVFICASGEKKKVRHEGKAMKTEHCLRLRCKREEGGGAEWGI